MIIADIDGERPEHILPEDWEAIKKIFAEAFAKESSQMTIPEAISQLDSLIVNSRSFHEEDGDIWERDIEALNMARAALEKSLGDAGWISVKERLPEPDGMVLVIVSGNPRKNIELDCAYELAEYCDSTGWILEEYPDWIGAEITHWMPLPEPPQSQK